MKKTPKDEIPLTPEVIEFFKGAILSTEELYLWRLDEPKRELIRDSVGCLSFFPLRPGDGGPRLEPVLESFGLPNRQDIGSLPRGCGKD